MTELELQSEYVMDFFCRRADGLGFREIKNNAVSPDLFIPANLYEFLKENSRKAWNSLLKKSEYNGDEQKLLRAIMDMIREKIEASANVAIFLNKNRTITFEGETLQLIYVSGSELRGDEDFNKNIFAAVEEMSYSFHHDAKKIFAFRPDLSFFVNGIFLGYAELKSNFTNQTAKTNGRNKIITDYLEAVWEYTKIANGNDVSQTLRRRMLRPFEKSIHLVTTDITDTYILRDPGQFFDEAKRGFQDNTISISSFRPVVEKVFKPLPIKQVEATDPRVRFEEAMRSLYSKKMIEKEILYYNFMAYTYKTVTSVVNGHKVQKKEYKDKTGRLICPRPKQKFGCDRIMERVQEFLDHENEPLYFINRLRAELQALNAPQDLIDRVVAERDSYCNNKYVYSLLLQYAAGFGKSNIIGWTALQLKDLRYKGEWVYNKILLVVDRLQLRDQLDSMMLNMNIDKAMFVEATDQDTFVKALSDKRRIIVVNIQKFWELKKAIEKAGKDFKNMRVAFLIDEVHRSNTDDVHQEMYSAFDELQDIFDEDGGFITKGSTKKNLIVGFTATPSDRVLARFGEFHRSANFINQLWKPFDSYTMKGAIADGYILDPTKHIIPVPLKTDNTDLTNAYQISINLCGDSWIGYFSPRDNKWNEASNTTTFFFSEGWVNLMYEYAITNIFAPWIQLKNINMSGENPNKEMYAIAQISKIMGLHRSTDKFGPIPYKQVGNGSFTVEYDSQESVYRSFFEELDEAVTVLYDFYMKANNTVPMASDVVYEGDVTKWIRLANSLMLRLAIRVRYADEVLARTYAEKAIKNPIGVMESIDDMAKMNRGANLQTKHPMYQIADPGQYNDSRMGATIQCYMKGYADPRISKYFQDQGKNAIRAGLPVTQKVYDGASLPNISEDDPVYWMRASEVDFLRAEGALAGFDMGGGTPQQYYESGIRKSFAECGASIGSYLNSTTPPLAFTDPVNAAYNYTAPSIITVKWNEADDVEKKLERIITQKYLALFPDGQEAWSEWRRTGYPRQIPPVNNFTNSDVKKSDGHKDGVRRIPYPRNEYEHNGENLQKAIQQYLGGIDKASVNVWWDKKEKK